MSCSPGDWMCPACQHINFKKRDPCQRCSCPKYPTQVEVSSYTITQQKTEMLAGDWYCCGLNCGAHNYASRMNCYRCGGLKDYSGMIASAGYGYDALPGWKAGDWVCNRYGCGIHNYASRMECFKCKTPRENFGGAM